MSIELLRAGLAEKLGEKATWDPRMLTRLSRDQSIYEMQPAAVVTPQRLDDVVETVKIAAECGVPVTSRGGGSGTAGAALGRGVILHFRKNGALSWIANVEGDARCPVIEVGPAALHDELQTALAREGLFLPADPSSGALCLLGGNVATKASGPHALKHGSIDHYLLGVEMVLADGTVVRTDLPETFPASLTSSLADIRAGILEHPDVRRRLADRRGMKTASGYNLFPFLDAFDPGRLVTQLMAGSVGTLGVLTRIRLRAEPKPAGRVAVQVFFRGLEEACGAVPVFREAGAAAIEIMNDRTIALVGRSRRCDLFPADGCHLLLVEFSGDHRREQAEASLARLKGMGFTLACPPETAEEEEKMDRLWALRKGLLPIVSGAAGERKALTVVNDVGVKPERLAPFIRAVEQAFDRLGLDAAIYGHAGNGNLHLRPMFDVSCKNLSARLEETAGTLYQLVCEFGGTVTAEHGMGPLRAPFLEMEWGPDTVAVMRRVKQLFDPEALLNPGAMFPVCPFADHLRAELRAAAD